MTDLVDLIFLVLMSGIGAFFLGWAGFFGGLIAGVLIIFVCMYMGLT